MTPSNHPAVNVLWTIASAMGYPITIRPSLDDPFTPLRLINALVKAGMPARSFSYYPIPHSYVDEMVDLFDRCMIFGGPQLVHKYGDRSATKVYGPGRSVMIVGQNYADRIDEVVNLAVTSMMKDGGRGCINLSTIIVQKNAAGIAEKIAREVASLEIFSPLDPRARIGAYRQKTIAEAINSQIAMGLYDDTDVTSTFRSSPRVVEKFDAAFLQPTVILCRSPLKKRETLFGREFSFPFVTVTEIPDLDEIVAAASGSLVVTLLSHNQALLNKLLFSPDIAKVYHGAIATTEIDFQDPHEGFISGFLFKTKALRIENDYDCQQG